VRAGWRAAAFLLLSIVFLFALAWVVGPLLRGHLNAQANLTPGFIALNELLLLIPVAAATAIMTWAEGRPFLSCGLTGNHRLRRLGLGFAAGLALLAIIIFITFATGHAAIAWGGLVPASALVFATAWAAASLFTGFAEEIAFRGYLLQTLSRGAGFWPALILTSLLFGALHSANSGENAIGIAAAGLGGAIMALAIRGTGALWWAIGFHGAWDYAENFVAGTPDSGQICAYTLYRTSPHGADLLSGGPTGPEGSLFALALLIVAFGLAWIGFPRAPGAPKSPHQ